MPRWPTPALTDEQVREARRRRTDGERTKNLLRRFGVSSRPLYAALYGTGRYAHVRRPPPLGRLRAAPPPILTKAQVREARRRRRQGEWLSEIASRFGTSQDPVRKALYGRAPYEGIASPPPLPVSRSPIVRLSLSEVQVADLRRRVAGGTKLGALTKEFGVSKTTLMAAAYGHPPYDQGCRSRPSPHPRKGPQTEAEWERRRKMALTCTTWEELGRKLDIKYLDPPSQEAHGVRLLCSVCRLRPATTHTVRVPGMGRTARGRKTRVPSRIAACRHCARAHGVPSIARMIGEAALDRAGEVLVARSGQRMRMAARETRVWARWFRKRGLSTLPRLSDKEGWASLRRQGLSKDEVAEARGFLGRWWRAGRLKRGRGTHLELPVSELMAHVREAEAALRDPESVSRDPEFMARIVKGIERRPRLRGR